MKRTALARRAPLTTRAPLGNRSPMQRSGRVNPVSSRRVRQQRERRAHETMLGRAADGTGICALCGGHTVVHGHELDPAGYGKDFAHPDCLLCNPCNDLIECAPVWAARAGWKRSTKYLRDGSVPTGAARRWDGSLHWFGVGRAA